VPFFPTDVVADQGGSAHNLGYRFQAEDARSPRSLSRSCRTSSSRPASLTKPLEHQIRFTQCRRPAEVTRECGPTGGATRAGTTTSPAATRRRPKPPSVPRSRLALGSWFSASWGSGTLPSRHFLPGGCRRVKSIATSRSPRSHCSGQRATGPPRRAGDRRGQLVGTAGPPFFMWSSLRGCPAAAPHPRGTRGVDDAPVTVLGLAELRVRATRPKCTSARRACDLLTANASP
jgi:hypothetical protein